MSTYRNKIEQHKLCVQILKHIKSEPIPTRLIAAEMGIQKAEIRGYIEKLLRAKIIRGKQHFGIYRKSQRPITSARLDKMLTKNKHKSKPDTDSLIGEGAVKDLLTKRQCRDCKQFLPQSRYFKCYTCSPEFAQQSEDDFLYHGVGSNSLLDDLYLDDDGRDFFEEDISQLAKVVPKEEADD